MNIQIEYTLAFPPRPQPTELSTSSMGCNDAGPIEIIHCGISWYKHCFSGHLGKPSSFLPTLIDDVNRFLTDIEIMQRGYVMISTGNLPFEKNRPCCCEWATGHQGQGRVHRTHHPQHWGVQWGLFMATTMAIWLVAWNIWIIFPYVGKNNPNWLIFFRGVQTTNQQSSAQVVILYNPCKRNLVNIQFWF